MLSYECFDYVPLHQQTLVTQSYSTGSEIFQGKFRHVEACSLIIHRKNVQFIGVFASSFQTSHKFSQYMTCSQLQIAKVVLTKYYVIVCCSDVYFTKQPKTLKIFCKKY